MRFSSRNYIPALSEALQGSYPLWSAVIERFEKYAPASLIAMILRVRQHLFVFVQNRELGPTNNGSEAALCPCVIYRKITNGFRQECGVHLYADIRCVIETARRHAMRAIDAIRDALNTPPLQALSAAG